MKLTAFQAVMEGLHRHDVRFLLVGGMAVDVRKLEHIAADDEQDLAD